YVVNGLDITSNFTTGSSAAGVWTLKVRDLHAGNAGTINSFSLEVIGSSPTITAVTTAPGIHVPDNAGPPSPGSLRREIVQAPTCQTCDGIALDTDAHVQAKFDCLDTGLSTATGPLQLSLAARIKLLLQIAGERLTPTQRARAEAVYNENPAASTACSTAITWDASCPTDADPSHLTTQSQLCADLAGNPATSQGAAGAELTTCFAQLTALGNTANTCRLAMRTSADATAQTLVQKAQPSFAGDFAAALKTAVSRIDDWWVAATGLASSDQTWFFEQSGVLERWLWQTIEAQRNPLPVTNPTTDQTAVALLADIAQTRLNYDTSFLGDVFTTGLSSSAPPLLTFTGDALKVLAERVDRLEPIHDVGCRFRPCKNPTTGVVTSTATSQLVRALAALPDATAFTAALASATDVQSQLPDVYGALIKVRDQHQYLEAAWNRYARPEPFSQLAFIDRPPFEAEALAAIVRNATVASASYQDSGIFTQGNRPRLTASTLRQGDLVGFINSAIATSDGDRTLFTTNRLDTVKDLLDQSRSGAAARSQNDQIAELASRTQDLANRIDALELRDTTERQALAAFQTEFEAIVNSGVLDANAAYQSETLTPISASAADRHFPNAGARNVVRDHFTKIALQAGQQLRVHITGQWSPVCAVSQASIVDPNTNAQFPIVVDQALTGPEGYFVTISGNSYHAKSGSLNTGGSVGISTSACAANGGGCIGTSVTIPLPSTADTIGTEARMSATFTSGLRLATTPFPEAPAGALVAVITHKGITGAASDPPIIDIRVVQRDDLFVGPTPPVVTGWNDGGQTEIHFVVNDRAQRDDGSPCAVDTTPLQLNLTRVTPTGNVALQVGAAMADTLTAIEGQAQSVILEGELSAAEETSLRSDAWRRVETALVPSDIGLAGLPSELRQLFDAYLERELASISRRAQRRALVQQYLQLGLQIGGIVTQQSFTQDQDRLLHLIPRWRLRDLSGVKLAASTAGLAQVLTAYAAPIFELRDPAGFTVFRSQIASNAQLVTTNLKIMDRYEDSVDNLVQLARAVSGAVGSAQFEVPASQRRTVVIAVPRAAGSGHSAWT
ncbi:MAG TPA: proprotein convertase P-domain-containing protein, partial [Kofleriaceae bacterium]|nr:proprotein convertase P-domain-containing protein [Kofleriaceae bacterium]